MTLEYIPKISPDDVYNLLPIDYQEHTNPSDINEFDTTSNKELVRKRFYKLKLGESEIIHLTLGKNLKNVFNKTKSFYEECPEYSCKPLFVNDGQMHNLLGQEFFEGIPIDEKYASNKISDEDVSKIIRKIQRIFSSLEGESTHEAFLEEFNEFKETILSNNSLHLFDKDFLNKCVFPYLEDSLLPKSFSIRWSPGDLAARNILIDNELNFRIIDCEFAHKTHFHEEDWVRLAVFSSANFKGTPSVNQRLEQVDPWYHIYLFLRQTWLNRTIWQNENYKHFASEDLYNVLKLTESFGTNNKNVSLLIRAILDASRKSLNEILVEKDIRIQKENELDAEKQLRLYKENEHDEEKQLRVQKENELDVEKRLRVQKENELDAEKQLRVQKENELDAEKQLRVQKEKKLLIGEDKILRMQNSFSWKITSPLRFLRRKFLDPRIKSASTHQKSESEGNSYQDWIKKYDSITDDRIISFRKEFEDLKEKPLFSIIMPVYDPPKQFFEDALKSVINQVYTNWELCIADDRSNQPYVRDIIEKYSKKSNQIKVHINEKHSHISETSNNALKLAEGEFVVLMDHDDLLRPHSLLRLAQSSNKIKNLKIIYSDEDKINDEGIRSCPYFKPDWNPDLLLAQNYFCHLFCAERSLINKVRGFRKGFEGSQDWDLALRLIEDLDEKEIHHIPEILYHWRIHSGSVAANIDNKNYAIRSAKKAVEEHLGRLEIKAKVSVTQNQFIRVKRFETNQVTQKASIIIPTKNNFDVLKKCINSIVEKTPPDLFELIVVDNQTTDTKALWYYRELEKRNNLNLLKYQMDFNYSAINNFAAKQAKGDVLIFLNDDTEIITEDWLEELIAQAIRKEIGAVGSKLLYPDGTIQHAGIILGYCTIAGEMLKGLHGDHPGQMQRANLIQNVSAVTGACLAVEKSKFQLIGGFDEYNLKIAFNDVDLCLRLMGKGLKNLFTPEVLLYHHESKSRGKEDTPVKIKRFTKEINFMLNKWGELLQFDPAYNRNLSLNFQEQFEPAFPPR